MKSLRIGITHGDINGISYELLLKVFQEPEILELFTPVIFGSEKIANETAKLLELQPLKFNILSSGQDIAEGCLNLFPVCQDNEPELEWGKQTEAALKAEAKSLTAALTAYTEHQIDAIVTLPGHLDNDETSHSLTDFIRRALGSQEEAFDWILNKQVRLLQLHPIDVSTELGQGLAAEAFLHDVAALSQSLRQDFGLMRPRLAVVSPLQKLHAHMDELHEQGVNVFGPMEGMAFADGQWQHHYDGCLVLNDDTTLHALINQGEAELNVGYISGLPLVLTYPLQGIGYEQAGKGLSSEVPLRCAIYTAIDICRCRQSHHLATRNPLEKQWVPRGRDDFKLDLTKEE